ncbi:uncharacterized protein LOC106137691 [Amyelois transitella]|uniref:uncharacterized protein LOC106137691 n=1 Tax=Amyelois transitella TaxID=680683 RepID=UPI00298FF30F|nr:uncharacterized protein LOC106137691 [Amyelois transitella]
MEPGFIKANSSNLPRVDLLMLGDFLASNKDFCSSEFRNVKASLSSRPSYGDDAISYVQVQNDRNICTVKCKICPEHKVHAKLYSVTLIVDKDEEKVISVQCHDCVAAQGGCKHAIALLMWVHHRSEEPSCTEVQCYWKKSKLSRVGTAIKYITVKNLANSNGSSIIPSNSTVLQIFLEESQKKNLERCELLKFQAGYTCDELLSVSMHHLVLQFKEKCCNTFLQQININNNILIEIEKKTRDQHANSLWYELRYGRITASRAYDVSHCQTSDGALISLIMGGKIPDTAAMKRGRDLENKVRDSVSRKLKKIINSCGLFISQTYPMLAGSPDGVCEDCIVEIKCPMTEQTFVKYIKNGQPTKKCYMQIQVQMYLTGLKKCYFCVADPNFSTNSNVEIVCVTFNEDFILENIKSLVTFWETYVYPLLYRSIE